MDVNAWLPHLSLVVALLAAVVGPWVSTRIGARQIVAPIRQKWIDDLRNLIAEIISSAETIVNCHSADGILKDTHGVDAELFRKFKILERRLGLLLNSNEDDHKLLMATVSALVVDMIHGVNDYRKFHENIETIMITSQRILKAEWVRVKKGAL